MARQSFAEVVDEYREMQAHKMTFDMYRHWLAQVYEQPGKKGQPIESQPRKWNKLLHAWEWQIGKNIPGVANTVYAGLNAVTEVESSTLTEGSGKGRTHSALFGSGANIIKKARLTALELCK